jgi:hypothetical protein
VCSNLLDDWVAQGQWHCASGKWRMASSKERSGGRGAPPSTQKRAPSAKDPFPLAVIRLNCPTDRRGISHVASVQMGALPSPECRQEGKPTNAPLAFAHSFRHGSRETAIGHQYRVGIEWSPFAPRNCFGVRHHNLKVFLARRMAMPDYSIPVSANPLVSAEQGPWCWHPTSSPKPI